MKQKEIDENPLTVSSNSGGYDYYENNYGENKSIYSADLGVDVESDIGRIERYEYSNKVPKTLTNKCVNLKCKDNIQTLHFMQERYKQLETNYFNLENSRAKKYDELEEILKKKEDEKKHLVKINNLYENFDLFNIDYFKLKGLESKILKSLESIKDRKQSLLTESSFKYHLNNKICVICYETEIKILLKPCNHLCVCQQCSDKLEDTCPICRERIIIKESVKLS